MRAAIAIFVACTFCSGRVQADPSPSVRYLMGESVSMFEWGIFRLEARADRFSWDGLDIKNQFAHVDYDWAKNQLQVKVVVYPRYQSLQKTPARQVCGSLVKQMKSLFGVAPGFEVVREIDGIGSFFRHKNFDRADVPKTLGADLEAITSLEVETRYFTTSETR